MAAGGPWDEAIKAAGALWDSPATAIQGVRRECPELTPRAVVAACKETLEAHRKGLIKKSLHGHARETMKKMARERPLAPAPAAPADRSHLYHRADDDAHARALIRELGAHGVDFRWIEETGEYRPIVVRDDGYLADADLARIRGLWGAIRAILDRKRSDPGWVNPVEAPVETEEQREARRERLEVAWQALDEADRELIGLEVLRENRWLRGRDGSLAHHGFCLGVLKRRLDAAAAARP
jgi:hypothetical protein